MLRLVSKGLLLFEMIYLELYSLYSRPAYVRLWPLHKSEGSLSEILAHFFNALLLPPSVYNRLNCTISIVMVRYARFHYLFAQQPSLQFVPTELQIFYLALLLCINFVCFVLSKILIFQTNETTSGRRDQFSI